MRQLAILPLALATVLFLACSENLPDTQQQDIAPFADQATAQPTSAPPTEAEPPPPPPQPTVVPPPAPEPTSAPPPFAPPQSDCDPAYPTTCIPSPPPDLNCGDVAARRFQVLPPDPHGFDSDSDGVGCESG